MWCTLSSFCVHELCLHTLNIFCMCLRCHRQQIVPYIWTFARITLQFCQKSAKRHYDLIQGYRFLWFRENKGCQQCRYENKVSKKLFPIHNIGITPISSRAQALTRRQIKHKEGCGLMNFLQWWNQKWSHAFTNYSALTSLLNNIKML